MERRNLALLCAAVMCFWLFALAFGSSQGVGLAAVRSAPQNAQLVSAAVQPDIEPASSGVELNCRAAILIEQGSGTVLYELNADEQVPIASITKVMTLLLAFEAVHSGSLTLETLVPATEHACRMGGSQIWLEPGEQFTLDEMFRAICVSSANDAAVAVAELIGGSEAAFVQRMNERAQELGMTGTSFNNACGLDSAGHVSTARDVAVMSREILNTCPEVLNYTGIWTDSLRGGETQLVNTNKLLKRYSGITGLKTGTTGGAGVCISASAERDGLKLIAVILGAPSSADRFNSATALLDYGFANYKAQPMPDMSGRPLQVSVKGGTEQSTPLDYSSVPDTVLLKKSTAGDVTAEYTVAEQLDAPVSRRDTAGTVTVKCGDTVLGEYSILAAADVPKLDIAGAMRKLWESLIGQ